MHLPASPARLSADDSTRWVTIEAGQVGDVTIVSKHFTIKEGIRPAAPMRLTMVAGVPTFDNGEFTGKFPGAFIGPVPEFAQALAAE